MWTWSTIGSITSALTALAAAMASIWSAKAARDAVAQSSRLARQAVLRDLSQSVSEVNSRGEQIDELVKKLKVARQTQFSLAGQNVNGAESLLSADEQKRATAEYMTKGAHALEMRSYVECSDDELHALTRNMGSYATRLQVMETGLARELERIEAENRGSRARNRCPPSP